MEKEEFKNTIVSLFSAQIGFTMNNLQVDKYFDFMNLLIEKNKVMNLTAITEPKEIITKHFLDSSILYKFYLNNLGNKIILDLGTGAGFPGIPLAIIDDKDKYVLSDTLGKRINFLKEVVDKLNLSNVKLIKARAEDLAHDNNHREQYDYVLSRGVARISVLSEYSLPFVKIGGSMISYKMSDCDEELQKGEKAIKILGGKFHVKHDYSIIPNEPNRSIIEISKVIKTPKSYPRKAGTPSKSPIE